MANVCTTNYVIEGDKNELHALYQTMFEIQKNGNEGYYSNGLIDLVEKIGLDPKDIECRGGWYDLKFTDNNLCVTFETAWTPCYEVIHLINDKFPSFRIYYKSEEPGCEIFIKNDVDGKYFPETEIDGYHIDIMTEEIENHIIKLIHQIQNGEICLVR